METPMRMRSPVDARWATAGLVAAVSLWSCSGSSGGNSGASAADAANAAGDSSGAADAAVTADVSVEGSPQLADGGGSPAETGGGGGGDSASDSMGMGTGGEGGGDGAAPLTLVTPIQRGTNYVLEFGKTTFVVDPNGARISGFTLDGTNILTGPSVNAMYWGSTLWTSPQGQWWPNMLGAIDSAPYMMSVGTDSSITGQSGVDTFAGKQVSVTKHFSADLTNGSVVIQYSMTNKGTAATQLGHWEVTRVPPGGLTFYPAGPAAPVIPYGPIQLQKVGAYLWFDETKFPMGTAGKSLDYPTGGWVAHVMPDPAGDIVLIKVFPDIAAGSAGAGDGELEIFDTANKTYVEIEVLNKMLTLAPGTPVPWQVRWFLRRLPVGTMRTVGNQALVDFVIASMH
jgi:hypothetical protein